MTPANETPVAPLPEVDVRPVWCVVEVGDKLMHSMGPHAFQVMRVDDHNEAVDLIVDKAAAAVKALKERQALVREAAEAAVGAYDGMPDTGCDLAMVYLREVLAGKPVVEADACASVSCDGGGCS